VGDKEARIGGVKAVQAGHWGGAGDKETIGEGGGLQLKTQGVGRNKVEGANDSQGVGGRQHTGAMRGVGHEAQCKPSTECGRGG
jgi:hypothetical protein